MAIGADDKITAGKVTLFGKQLVADSFTDVIDRCARLLCKISKRCVNLGRLFMRRRRVVIQDKGGFRRESKGSLGDLAHGLHCSRRTGVSQHREVDVSDKKITWLAVRYCSMGRKDFFDDRVAHKVCLYRVLK